MRNTDSIETAWATVVDRQLLLWVLVACQTFSDALYRTLRFGCLSDCLQMWAMDPKSVELKLGDSRSQVFPHCVNCQ